MYVLTPSLPPLFSVSVSVSVSLCLSLSLSVSLSLCLCLSVSFFLLSLIISFSASIRLPSHQYYSFSSLSHPIPGQEWIFFSFQLMKHHHCYGVRLQRRKKWRRIGAVKKGQEDFETSVPGFLSPQHSASFQIGEEDICAMTITIDDTGEIKGQRKIERGISKSRKKEREREREEREN